VLCFTAAEPIPCFSGDPGSPDAMFLIRMFLANNKETTLVTSFLEPTVNIQKGHLDVFFEQVDFSLASGRVTNAQK
jgi:hypothetical protein